MPLTKSEYDEASAVLCPHCADGNTPRYREETREWVHDLGSYNKETRTQKVAITLCWQSNALRNKYAKE